MSKSNDADKAISMDKIISELSKSAMESTKMLDNWNKEGDNKKLKQKYIIPKFSINVSMEFTYSGNKMRGLLSRTKSKENNNLNCSIQFDMIAIPIEENTSKTE